LDGRGFSPGWAGLPFLPTLHILNGLLLLTNQPKKGVTVIEGIKVAGIKIEEIKTDESDGCVGSGFSVVTLSITAMPLFAAVLRQNACMLAAR
jgi:hypothetical protein